MLGEDIAGLCPADVDRYLDALSRMAKAGLWDTQLNKIL